jgi:hypothetical protein
MKEYIDVFFLTKELFIYSKHIGSIHSHHVFSNFIKAGTFHFKLCHYLEATPKDLTLYILVATPILPLTVYSHFN